MRRTDANALENPEAIAVAAAAVFVFAVSNAAAAVAADLSGFGDGFEMSKVSRRTRLKIKAPRSNDS